MATIAEDVADVLYDALHQLTSADLLVTSEGVRCTSCDTDIAALGDITVRDRPASSLGDMIATAAQAVEAVRDEHVRECRPTR